MRLRQAAELLELADLSGLATQLRAIATDPVANAPRPSAPAAPVPSVSQTTAQLPEPRVAPEPPAYTRDEPVGWWERKW
jgi:hypothetical protein